MDEPARREGDIKGPTAFQVAFELNYNDLLQLLLDRGANPDQEGPDLGATALMECAYYSKPEQARMLIEAGADISLRRHVDEAWWSPILTRAWTALEIAKFVEGKHADDPFSSADVRQLAKATVELLQATKAKDTKKCAEPIK